MKRINRIKIAVLVLLLFAAFVWWFDIGSWKPLQLEQLLIYPADFSYRDENDEKVEEHMYTWYSFFRADNFSHPIDKAIYDLYNTSYGFDFSQYTYILSYGYTIEQLYYKGKYDEPRMRFGKVIHGIRCAPNEIILYRVPKIYIEPGSDRTSTFLYQFIR